MIIEILTDKSESSTSAFYLENCKVVTADCSPARLEMGTATKKFKITKFKNEIKIFHFSKNLNEAKLFLSYKRYNIGHLSTKHWMGILMFYYLTM